MSRFASIRTRYDADGLIWHSFVMMFFQHMGSFANLMFHVVMGWALSTVEYGVLASMLGLVLILATPMLALQNTLAHFAARLKKEGHAGAIPALVWLWYKKLFPAGLAISVVAIALSGPLSDFFHLQSRLPIILVGVTLSGTLFMSIIPGALQGMQKFFWMCMTINTWGFVRLGLGFLLVWLVGRTASLGLVAQAAGVYGMILVGYFSLRHVLRDEPRSTHVITGVEQYFWKSLLTLLSYGFLMNADIVMVKHFFVPERAGIFAQAATIGRTVVFLCQPIATALFPKVVSGGQLSCEHRGTLVKALVFSVVLVGGAALAVTLIPRLPLLVLFREGNPTAEQIGVVRMVIWAMAPAGLTLVLLNFEMAQHRFRMLLPLSLCAVAYVVGVTIWHETFAQVVIVLATVSTVAAVSLIAMLPWRSGVKLETQPSL